MATGGSEKDAEVDDSVTNRTCAICLENFRRPKLLPCFHTFCQSCLQGVAGSSPTLSCPACRTPVLLGVKGVRGLQDNFYIESDSSASSHPQQRLCDVCTEDKEATYTCIQCQQKFCLPCRKNHDAFKGCYGHTVVSLLPEDTDGCQKGGASPQNVDDKPKQEMCPKHPDQRLLLRCKQCQADICIQCKLTQHDGHSTDDLVDVQAKAKTSVEDMLRDVTQQRQQISHLILALGDRRAKLQQQQQETERGCQERADTLHQWVNQSVDDMVTSLQMTTRELDQPLQDQVELLQNKDLVLQAQQEHVARVLKDDLNTDIVSLETQLSSSLLHSTEFKQIEKELTADIPKLQVKHTSSAVNQLQLREFVGVLQPVQPASFPVQPNSVTAGADSTNNQSPLKSPQDGTKKKPPREFQYSRNPESSIVAMCPISQNRLWVMYTPKQDAAPVLKLFDADGQVLTTVHNAQECDGLVTISDDNILSWIYSRKNANTEMIDPHGNLSTHKLMVAIGNLVPSAKNDGQYLRVDGSTHLCRVKFLVKDKLSYFQMGAVCIQAPLDTSPGHVSFKGEFTAFVDDGEVSVYTKSSTQKSGPFSRYQLANTAPIDARFCQVDGNEQLLVLAQDDKRVHIVDHMDGGSFVRYLDTGPVTLSGHQHLATNFDQHVWVGCRGGKVAIVPL